MHTVLWRFARDVASVLTPRSRGRHNSQGAVVHRLGLASELVRLGLVSVSSCEGLGLGLASVSTTKASCISLRFTPYLLMVKNPGKIIQDPRKNPDPIQKADRFVPSFFLKNIVNISSRLFDIFCTQTRRHTDRCENITSLAEVKTRSHLSVLKPQLAADSDITITITITIILIKNATDVRK